MAPLPLSASAYTGLVTVLVIAVIVMAAQTPLTAQAATVVFAGTPKNGSKQPPAHVAFANTALLNTTLASLQVGDHHLYYKKHFFFFN